MARNPRSPQRQGGRREGRQVDRLEAVIDFFLATVGNNQCSHGARVYWQPRPLFVAFILGEALAAALWLLLDALVGVEEAAASLFV